MPFTVVSFHAHPDDEALLVAGTLARAVAEGHRVILVAATDGAAGLAASRLTDRGDLAAVRVEELRHSARAIGCDEVRLLGYDDSGMDGRAGRPGQAFATADPDEAASRLAAILGETGADVLTVYDPAGGYGHPDHVRVNLVGREAARRAGTPVVLEATVDRRPLLRVLHALDRTAILRLLGVDRREWSADRFARAFADPGLITHKVDVRRYSGVKRSSMAAHSSQAGGDGGVRTLAAFLRLPPWLFQRVFAHEWFVEQGRRPGPRPLDDIFASLRPTRPDHDVQFGNPG